MKKASTQQKLNLEEYDVFSISFLKTLNDNSYQGNAMERHVPDINAVAHLSLNKSEKR